MQFHLSFGSDRARNAERLEHDVTGRDWVRVFGRYGRSRQNHALLECSNGSVRELVVCEIKFYIIVHVHVLAFRQIVLAHYTQFTTTHVRTYYICADLLRLQLISTE